MNTPPPLPDPRPASIRLWCGFLFMCLGMFMAILDIQIVTTSLPTIERALGIGIDRMSWIQTAYLVAEIIAIPLTGYLTRVLGMRLLFVVAIGLFTLASAGCAASQSFEALIACRIVQGFAGGTLIPAVFSAVFLLFPVKTQGIATSIAGVAAVFAPTVGPIVGGWLTETFSWHWLFLVNVVPGIVAAGGAAVTLRRDSVDWRAGSADFPALVLMAFALAAFEIGLKDGPHWGWHSAHVLILLFACAAAAAWFVTRSLRAAHPLVELHNFADRQFTLGCILSFILGIGLFGSTYLMPFFLGIVRGHGALDTGKVMLVTGIAQLVAAPAAVVLERRVNPRVLIVIGFALFAAGSGMSAFQTRESDFAQMVLPQILRGSAIMFCLLPPTRLALGTLPPDQIAQGSGLFNLMRNLGGAVGLALVDTVIFTRSKAIGLHIADQLRAGNADTAVSLGIPRELFLAQADQPVTPEMQQMLRPLIEQQALVQSINQAWMLLAVIMFAALPLVALIGSARARTGPRDQKSH